MSFERTRNGGARLGWLGLVALIWAAAGCREQLVVGTEPLDEPPAVARSGSDGGGEEAADQAEGSNGDDENGRPDDEDSEDDDEDPEDVPDEDE